MIPAINHADLREIYFQVCFTRLGYGLNITPAQLDDMQLDELFWYRDRVAKQHRETK